MLYIRVIDGIVTALVVAMLIEHTRAFRSIEHRLTAIEQQLVDRGKK